MDRISKQGKMETFSVEIHLGKVRSHIYIGILFSLLASIHNIKVWPSIGSIYFQFSDCKLGSSMYCIQLLQPIS